MSYYDDDNRPRRHRSERQRRPRATEYSDETYVESRGNGPRSSRQQTDLVRRPREDSDLSVEEVERDFPPGGGGYVKRKTTVREGGVRRAHSAGRDRGYYDGYGDPRRNDDFVAVKRSSRRYGDGGGGGGRYDDDRDRGGRRERRSKRYDSYSDSSRSPSPRGGKRRKSMGEQALAALGLGGALGAAAGNRDRSHSRTRSRGGRRRSYSDSRSRSRGGGHTRGQEQIGQAIKAGLLAGATEAFRARKEPGGWGGEKGKRVLTAAITAGGVDKAIDRDPDKHSKRHVIESAVAGLATNRLVNGPRSRSRSRGRGRSSSRGGGGSGNALTELAAGGALAAAGKAIYDRVRSKSRGRRRSDSGSSFDSRSPPRRGEKKRSKSLSGYIGKGLAAAGFADAADKVDRPRDRRRRDDSEDDYYRSSRNGPPRDRDGGYSREVGRPRSQAGAVGSTQGDGGARKGGGSSSSNSDSDLGSSTDEEKKRKKLRGKEFLTAGLATVATIHAAHNVYQSIEKREERHRAVAEGEMTPEEAKKKKNQARVKDAASIGIAALGIKGAVTEWKEMKEQRNEVKEFREKQLQHKEKRAKKRSKSQGGYGSSDRYGRSEPNLQSSGGGPTYYDGNPYAAGALPPPPPGPPPARY